VGEFKIDSFGSVRSGPPRFGAGAPTAEHSCDLAKLWLRSFAFEAAPECCVVKSTKSFRVSIIVKFANDQISIGIRQPLAQLQRRTMSKSLCFTARGWSEMTDSPGRGPLAGGATLVHHLLLQVCFAGYIFFCVVCSTEWLPALRSVKAGITSESRVYSAHFKYESSQNDSGRHAVEEANDTGLTQTLQVMSHHLAQHGAHAARRKRNHIGIKMNSYGVFLMLHN
jgi:hypothetical protein